MRWGLPPAVYRCRACMGRGYYYYTPPQAVLAWAQVLAGNMPDSRPFLEMGCALCFRTGVRPECWPTRAAEEGA